MSDTNPTVDLPGAQAAPPVPADFTVPADSTPQPQRIGRYRVERLLGKGGFGLVYLAHDEQLQRLVAVKVPHRTLVSRPEDAEAYLTEARTVATLDHPNIVSVHDVGSTEDCPCYVVSKYIDGTDLATRLKRSRLSLHEAVDLVATVAEALHYAHKQGLVHRDVKPGNILLDNSGKPFVADFGLALRERDVGKGPRYAGTPALALLTVCAALIFAGAAMAQGVFIPTPGSAPAATGPNASNPSAAASSVSPSAHNPSAAPSAVSTPNALNPSATPSTFAPGGSMPNVLTRPINPPSRIARTPRRSRTATRDRRRRTEAAEARTRRKGRVSARAPSRAQESVRRADRKARAIVDSVCRGC